MEFPIITIALTLFASQWCRFFVNADFVGVQMCMQDKTISLDIYTSDDNGDVTCQCQVGPASNPTIREDYVHTPGVGSHKLHTSAKTWNEARKICNEENGHLAIINSKAEAEALLKIFRKERGNIQQAVSKEQAFLGIHDIFEEGEWQTVFGESLYSTGYAEWSSTCWGRQPDNHRKRQNCGTLVMKCASMDDVYCDVSYAFFCELPLGCA